MLLSLKDCPKFENYSLFVTTREWWESLWKYSSFNMWINSGDEISSVLKNRKILAQVLWKQEDNFLYLNQTHSDSIFVVDEITDSKNKNMMNGYDACITNQQQYIPLITVADCVPIILLDEVKSVSWAIHSGWKGTAKNITAKTIEKMISRFTCSVSDIKIIIGPCISQDHYEVDEKVIQHFDSQFYTKNENGWYLLDLRAIIVDQVRKIWVWQANIHHIDLCTFSHTQSFFSTRRDGFESWRFLMWVYKL